MLWHRSRRSKSINKPDFDTASLQTMKNYLDKIPNQSTRSQSHPPWHCSTPYRTIPATRRQAHLPISAPVGIQTMDYNLMVLIECELGLAARSAGASWSHARYWHGSDTVNVNDRLTCAPKSRSVALQLHVSMMLS